MKILTRILSTVFVVLAFLAIATEARAQFPQCNDSVIIIRNPTPFDVRIGLKGLGYFFAPAGQKTPIIIIPGTQIPGVAGAANTTHVWQPLGFPPPPYWVPSVQFAPSFRCFNVYYDGNCIIDLELTTGPPCLNP